jgi:hypothetical protein
LVAQCIRRANGSSEGNSRSRTAQADRLSTRCMISGTVPAPIHTARNGHSAGRTRRSGASTSEKRRLPSGGRRPGGAMVQRRDSVRPKPTVLRPSCSSSIGLPQ